ncbi:MULTISPECIES: DUF2461 domain-containing protein [Rhodococcus]|uniref:TIGR02453 family protein n=1 Tax=Rhodococcoides kyotonense TaxID=398843 RepID=A0A177Y6W9_9NOCA|nr:MULTISPECIES: DUF2461 domain-containing protein [Rhodococcus]NIL77748.1 hypothetical protein [Rhodococcus sp. B10]OAK51244.1 TIGR02453 family protein [Rhodococcus kyotonensis]
MAFTGFPFAALDFYEDLEADNSKPWWNAHKDVYEESVKVPMVELLAELKGEFGSGKVFRPYRDVRFSKDKTPYKTHQGGFVARGPSLGFYVQIDPAGLFVAGGFYGATTDGIALFRDAVDNEVRGTELEGLVSTLTEAGFDIGGDRLKTKPRGYELDHPRIDLLRHKSLTASTHFGSPPWLETAAAADHVRTAWRTLVPLVEWAEQVMR